MINPVQNYNWENLEFMKTFLQLKKLNPSIPFRFDNPKTTFSNIDELAIISYMFDMFEKVVHESSLGSKLNNTDIGKPPDQRGIEKIIKNITLKANKDHFNKVLKNLHKECEEEGFEVFDKKAETNAKQILDFLCENFPEHDFDIYPTEDREIEIYNTPGKGRGILITCDSDGSVAYFKTDDKDSRHRCQDIKRFPFELLRKEIESLERHKILLFEYPTMPPQQNEFKITGESSEYKSA